MQFVICRYPEDCGRVARCQSIPKNPLTILQSMCNPFNLGNSICNRLIQGQFHRTSQFWDDRELQPRLLVIPPEQLHNWHTILGCLAQSIWIASGLQILKGLQVNWENCIKIVWVALEGLHHIGGRRSAFMQSCDRFAIHSASENPLTIS